MEGAEVDIATHAGDSITGDLMTNLPRSGPEEDADRDRRRARPVGVDGVAGGGAEQRAERLPRCQGRSAGGAADI